MSCGECGSLSCTPVPSQEELAYYYGNHFDYGWYRQRAVLKKIQAKERWRRVAHLLTRREIPKGRSLDIGCGHGHFVKSARTAGWDAWGVDYASTATAFGRDALGLNIVEGALGEAVLRGDLPSGSFNLITAWHCAEHVSQQKEFFGLIARLLAPGGMILVAVPNAESTGMISRRERWTWCQQPYLHVVHYTGNGLAGLMTRAGLTVSESWSRDTWDANWLSDEVLGDAPRAVAKLFGKVNWRLAFAFEEGLRLACYSISGFHHWALGLETRALTRAELSVLATAVGAQRQGDTDLDK